MKFYQKIITLCLLLTFIGCSSIKHYTVKRGDSLYKIAKKYNVSVSYLKKVNSLKSNNISTGQSLIVSKNSSTITRRSGSRIYDSSYKKSTSIPEKKTNVKKVHVSRNISNDPFLKRFKPPLKDMRINSPYGYRFHPILHRNILHTGADLHAVKNTPVYAPYKGKVTFAGWMNGYGKVIIIKHNEHYQTRFAHLNRILVDVGDDVRTGELIAKSGKTGRVTSPHLHFEVRYDGKSFDPMVIFK